MTTCEDCGGTGVVPLSDPEGPHGIVAESGVCEACAPGKAMAAGLEAFMSQWEEYYDLGDDGIGDYLELTEEFGERLQRIGVVLAFMGHQTVEQDREWKAEQAARIATREGLSDA